MSDDERERAPSEAAALLAGRQAGWTEAKVEALLPALDRRRRRRRAVRASAGAAVVGIVAAATLRLFAPGAADRQPLARTQTGGARDHQFVDGSRAMPLSPSTRFEVLGDSGQRAEVALTAGSVRFAVDKGRPRLFTVRSGDVQVTVSGTIFTVARSGPRTYVAVHEGRVTVAWPGGERPLGAGERGEFPPPSAGREPGSLELR